MKELINVEGVCHAYGRRPTLRGVDLAVGRGEIVALLGPNGSGKTTLLKIILGLLRPGEGRVLLGGRDIAEMTPRQLARRIAYVPQVHRTAFAYRVLDVVLMGRLAHKPFLFRYSDDDRRRAMRALERLGLIHLAERPYTDISGGERQLTLIARALAQDAEVFVMDEPANGLDYGNQIRLLEKLNDLARDGATFIKTTHFPDHALWVSDRVVMLSGGGVMADGEARRVINQANLFRLYGASIGVERLPGGGMVCIPRAMRGGAARPAAKPGPAEATG